MLMYISIFLCFVLYIAVLLIGKQECTVLSCTFNKCKYHRRLIVLGISISISIRTVRRLLENKGLST